MPRIELLRRYASIFDRMIRDGNPWPSTEACQAAADALRYEANMLEASLEVDALYRVGKYEQQ